MHSATRIPSQALQSYSGNEQGSYSDFSDTGFLPDSTLSLPAQESREDAERRAKADAIYSPSKSQQRPQTKRNTSQISNMQTSASERVVYHGYLYLLKSKGGVRQWKSVWAVLRPKSLALYKNEEEYSALLVLAFPSIIDAADIDPQSRSKRFCLQIITEERTYRFCALSEEDLAKWVGAFKSLLKRRKDHELLRGKERERKELESLQGQQKDVAAVKGKENQAVGSSKVGIGTPGREVSGGGQKLVVR